MAVVEVVEQAGLSRLPPEGLARDGVGSREVERDQIREEPKVSRQHQHVRGNGHGGNAQAAANGLGDVAERDTLVAAVQRWVQRKWGDNPAAQQARCQARIAASWPPPSSRQCIGLLMAPEEKLKERERLFVAALKRTAPAVFVAELKRTAPTLIAATELAGCFANLMRNRDPAGFDQWLDDANGSALASFVDGLLRDREAVRAAFEESWSTSPVEGQINRLKTIKRQMYGRAGYPLLRSRTLIAA